MKTDRKILIKNAQLCYDTTTKKKIPLVILDKLMDVIFPNFDEDVSMHNILDGIDKFCCETTDSFWISVLRYHNYKAFFEKYPVKKSLKNKKMFPKANRYIYAYGIAGYKKLVELGGKDSKIVMSLDNDSLVYMENKYPSLVLMANTDVSKFIHKYGTCIDRIEFKEDILDDKEKKYLLNVIRPFKKDVVYISKLAIVNSSERYIFIKMKEGGFRLPSFNSDMYSGMKDNSIYLINQIKW